MATRKTGKRRGVQRDRKRSRKRGGGNGPVLAVVGVVLGLGLLLSVGWMLQPATGTQPDAEKGSRQAAGRTPAEPTTQPGTGASGSQTAASEATGGSTADGAAEKEVVAVFERYRGAAMACKGADAVECVDSHTMEYFQKMLDLARTGSAAEVHRQTYINRMMILMCRAQYKPEELKNMTGRMLFISGIDRGQTSKQAMLKMSVGRVRIEGDVAVMAMRSEGKETSVSMEFRREGGQWRLDFTGLLKLVDMAMKTVAQDQDMDEDDLLMSVLETTLGHKPGEEIWEPVFPEY